MRTVTWCVLAGLSTVQAAPAAFHTAVQSLALPVRHVAADRYVTAGTVRIQYDPSTPGILVSNVSVPLGSRGVAVAAALVPAWCGPNLPPLPAGHLSGQMERSERLNRAVESGQATSSLVRSRAGHCEIQTLSNSLESFVLLKRVPGASVWPPTPFQENP
ncbi:hypothetical protein [Deinococcus aquiradiocola]|uniref:Uncharacterized protein n=1 Tax=Deinococcus aquiradiocola TaxID=393059 RepID=A0A917URK1_9DEIO|nr:hypothetical protein [Deinococcus aquiradiocola]GGJ79394.1 hypothetical protein GCM10008939_24040 [Deinococcus aquiradiocola]